ncbi:MAG: hypothetical protein ACM3Q2_06835 [Syntrophothermus sp.]
MKHNYFTFAISTGFEHAEATLHPEHPEQAGEDFPGLKLLSILNAAAAAETDKTA